VGLSH